MLILQLLVACWFFIQSWMTNPHLLDLSAFRDSGEAGSSGEGTDVFPTEVFTTYGFSASDWYPGIQVVVGLGERMLKKFFLFFYPLFSMGGMFLWTYRMFILGSIGIYFGNLYEPSRRMRFFVWFSVARVFLWYVYRCVGSCNSNEVSHEKNDQQKKATLLF